MKRNLVVTSSTTVRVQASSSVELDAAIEAAVAGERARLTAYLYHGAQIVAVVHEVQPQGDSHRVVQRALVTVEGNDAADARYLADYQGGRLQSGSFGVIDYVEDEMAARDHVGLADEDKVPSDYEERVKAALEYAISCLSDETVTYALGLDSDHLECSTVTEHGVERPRTEDDLRKELARHESLVQTLQDVLLNR